MDHVRSVWPYDVYAHYQARQTSNSYDSIVTLHILGGEDERLLLKETIGKLFHLILIEF